MRTRRDNAIALIALILALIVADLDAQRLRLRLRVGTAAVEEPPEEPPPSGTGHNDYYDTLCARADAETCVTLRDQSTINLYDTGGDFETTEADATYDASEDALLWTWETDEKGGEKLYVPLGQDATYNIPHPVSGSQKWIVITDLMLDDSWLTECIFDLGRTCGFKWLQLTDSDTIWFEWQNYIAQGNVANNDAWMLPFYRVYYGLVEPSTVGGQMCSAGSFPIDISSETAPTFNGDTDCFKAQHSTWMRVATEVKHTAGNNYAEISTWMMDENQEPISLLENVREICDGPHDYWIYEWDTSADTRTGGVMKAWARNMIVLLDYPEEAITLLEKPMPTNRWTYEEDFSTRSNAALHGQDSWAGVNPSSETGIVVQATTAAPGTTKAAEITSMYTHLTVERDLPDPIASGNMFIDIRKSHTSSTVGGLVLNDTGGAARMYVNFDDDGLIKIYDGATDYVSIQAYTANIWNRINLQFNDASQPNKYRARVKTWNGSVWSAWGTWSAWVDVSGSSYDLINTIEIGGEGNGSTLDHKMWFGNIAGRDQ